MIIHKNLKNNKDDNHNYSRRLIRGNVTATRGVTNPHNLTTVYGHAANRIEVLRALEKQNKFRLIWYTIFFVLGIVCLILEPKSWFYVLDLYVLLFNIDLASQGKLIGVYLGILECFMYVYISYISGLYGEIIKMLAISVPLNVFTIINWSKNLKQQKNKQKTDDENSVTIRKLNKSTILWVPLILIVIYVPSFFGLKALNTSALIFSAGALTLTIFNKILNGLRFKESWIFGIASSIISFVMWLEVMLSSINTTGFNIIELPVVLSMVACLSNSFYGYSMWKSMYRKIAVNGGEVLAIRKLKIKKIIKLRRQYQKFIWNKEVDTNKNS